MKQILLILFLIAASFAAGMAAAWYFQPLGSKGETTLRGDQPLALERVVALAKLQPRGGVFNVYGPTGLRLTDLLVRDGDRVEANRTELCRLTGQAALAMQVELAEARIFDTELELQVQKSLAESNVRAAELQVQTAQLNLQLNKQQGNLDVEQRKIKSAEDKLERLRKLNEDPDTKSLFSIHAIEDQEIALDQARRELTQAQLALSNSKESLQLALQAAEQNRDSAKLAAENAAKACEANRTAKVARQIAELQASESRVLAPITGTVLKIFLRNGESIVNTPIMQLGDLTGIECVAEVNESLVSRIHVGQRVTIRDQALPRSLGGTVCEIGKIVGTPSFRDPNPLAMVDRRAVEVVIDLDRADAEAASDLLNLQVTVEIDTNDQSASASVIGEAETGENP